MRQLTLTKAKVVSRDFQEPISRETRVLAWRQRLVDRLMNSGYNFSYQQANLIADALDAMVSGEDDQTILAMLRGHFGGEAEKYFNLIKSAQQQL